MAQLKDTMVQGDLRVTGSIYGNISGNAATASAAQAGSALETAINSKSTLTLGETSSTAYRGDRGKTAYNHSQATHAPTTSKTAANGGTDLSLVTTGEKYTWNAKSTLALGETSSTAYRGDRGKTAYDHSQATHAPTTSSAAASGGTTLSLVTTGEKYTWNNKSTLALGETSSTAYRGDRGKTAYDHSQATHAPTTSSAAASGGTTLSLVTTGEKYTWNNKSTLALGETSSTAYRGDRGKTAYDHSQATHAPTTSSAAASGGTTLSLVTTGEKYTWNNKSNLAIGTTSSTAAAGNHTHTTSIASDSSSGTVVSLAHNTQYKLTAGGTSVLFKTPADNNTDTNVKQTADDTSSGTGFEVLFSATGDNTTRTEASRKSSKLTFQPSTGTLTATKFSGPLTGNVTGNCSGSSGSCTGNAATATKATKDSEGYDIKANYMRTTSGNKSLSFGGTTTIGKTNGSDVKLVMPEANADVFEVSANSTSFSDVLAAYNAHKKLILQIGYTLPGTTMTAIYNIPLNRIVYSDDTPVIFVWVYTQDSLTGDTNRGVITTWSLGGGSTGWASDEKYTYYSDTAGLCEKASALIDFGDTSRMTRVGWGGSSIGKVIASGSSTSLSESSFLAGYYVAEGMGHVKDVKAANVTVGNATKWNGWSIVVGSTGTDANTLYFV